MCNLVSTKKTNKQNECKCFSRINVIHFLKYSVLTNANLTHGVICKRFQSRLQVDQIKSYGVTLVLFVCAGFTYRLYRLKPRASRSKGASKNCGTHRVNGRYMII